MSEISQETKMVTEYELTLNSQLYNEATRNKHLLNEIYRSTANWHLVQESFTANRGFCLSKAPRVKRKPVIIIGSGPTLDKHIDKLKDWKHDVICSTSQASTLNYYGKDPKYIVALDPDSAPNEFDSVDWTGTGTALITHPGVHNATIDYWVNKTDEPIYYFRKFMPATVFYDNAQKVCYSDKRDDKYVSQINQTIVMLGCVVNCEISIAHMLGYSPMYLLGCDFGFPGEQTRFTAKYYNKEDGTLITQEPSPVYNINDTKEINTRIIKSENGILTNPMQIFYKRNMMSAWRLDCPQIVNTGKNTITELPYAPFEEVLKRQGKMGGKIKGYSKKKIIHESEKFMARFDVFVMRHNKGIEFIESKEKLLGVKDKMFKFWMNSMRTLERKREEYVSKAATTFKGKYHLFLSEVQNIRKWYYGEKARIENEYDEDATIKAVTKVLQELEKEKMKKVNSN